MTLIIFIEQVNNNRNIWLRKTSLKAKLKFISIKMML